MSSNRRARIEEICRSARAHPAELQVAYVAEACADDVMLRDEILSVLAHAPLSQVVTEPTALPTLAPGVALSHYRIEERIGAGGMGEVFRAVDTRLNRSVAIKVSHTPFSLRFRREAQALAALSHPYICTLYDVGDDYLVMELVDGETLRERLGRGPLPMPEVLRLGAQVADALGEAHARGITHRDLKPGNVMLTRNGVKLLDFGLASLGNHSITQTGAVMGTPAYMAPEQQQGHDAGPQTDIYALGLMLVEMATGKRPVRAGGAVVATGLPEPLAHVVHRSLAEEPAARWRNAAEISALLEFGLSAGALTAGTSKPRWIVHAVWAIILIAAAGAAVILSRVAGVPATAPLRSELVTPPEADAGGIALSHDGTRMAYTGLKNGVPRLYVRTLDENGLVREMPGTEGAALPFWSPGDRSLAFFAESKLKRLEVETGSIQPLADATLSPSGGTWGKDGTILFSPNINGGIFRVSETGQGAVTLVVADGRNPKFLDDGRRFLFLKTRAPQSRAGVYAASLDATDTTFLVDAQMAIPGAAGHLLFLREGRLYVQRFDSDRLRLTGTVFGLEGAQVALSSDGASASVTASANGAIAFRDVSSGGQLRSIGWFDRDGVEVKRVTDRGGLSPALSPDEAQLAFSRRAEGRPTEGGPGVWLFDMARSFLEPFTAEGAGQTALFSSDGHSILFSSARNGFPELFTRPTNSSDEKAMFNPPKNEYATVATDWKGDYLLYRENAPNTHFDIWALRMSGIDNKPVPVLTTPAAERDAQFSPDMKWIAYESNKSGTSEIYVTQFPKSRYEFLVSTNGGAQVRWNPVNRNELFYVALDGRLTSVRLDWSADGDAVRVGGETALFQTHIGTVVQGAQKQQYVVSTDGQRFLVSNVIEDATAFITLISNWRPSSK